MIARPTRARNRQLRVFLSLLNFLRIPPDRGPAPLPLLRLLAQYDGIFMPPLAPNLHNLLKDQRHTEQGQDGPAAWPSRGGTCSYSPCHSRCPWPRSPRRSTPAGPPACSTCAASCSTTRRSTTCSPTASPRADDSPGRTGRPQGRQTPSRTCCTCRRHIGCCTCARSPASARVSSE
eukprot:755393-Hanusia_phi.AAC.7